MSSAETGLQPVRGMNDVLPAEIAVWQHLESTAREVFAAYGYQEIPFRSSSAPSFSNVRSAN